LQYKNVTVRRVEPDGIVLSRSSGISKVYFTELPKELQESTVWRVPKPSQCRATSTTTLSVQSTRRCSPRKRPGEKTNRTGATL